MLSINNASFKQDSLQFEIKCLRIKPLEHFAIIGTNGSGKSILAKIIAGKLPLIEGEYHNDFTPISHISFELLQQRIDDEWHRNNTDFLIESEDNIGITAKEVILENSTPDNWQTFQQLITLFGLSLLVERPFKYLSSGETRKILICQALMCSPTLLILEDPYDGLDVDSRTQLTELLHEIVKTQKITLVLIVSRFEQLPDFAYFIGILNKNNLQHIISKAALNESEFFIQLTQFKKHHIVDLPPAEMPTPALADDVPRIVLNHGTVSYHDKIIIDDLNWQVNSGQHWQIVGPNGAGKSTLLSLITGDHPQGYRNDLTLFGRKRGSGETIWEIKKHIGFVSNQLHQDYRISCSVAHVIISGFMDSIGIYQPISDKQQQLANEWLSLLQLTEKANAPFRSLSWGQQRLLLIVRALVKHPTLLILDEPLQGLDWQNREGVKQWLDHLLAQGRTQLLFVSHHMEDAPFCITHRLMFTPKLKGGYQYIIEHVAS